jgi:hypothetical protein
MRLQKLEIGENGAPEGTILELFFGILQHLCHSLALMVD